MKTTDDWKLKYSKGQEAADLIACGHPLERFAKSIGTSVEVVREIGKWFNDTQDYFWRSKEFGTLSIRVRNCLFRAGIMNATELAEWEKSGHLVRLRNFGRHSLAEVQVFLGLFPSAVNPYCCKKCGEPYRK